MIRSAVLASLSASPPSWAPDRIDQPLPRIAALLTCHNRRELTLRCIQRLLAQSGYDAHLDVVVLDAASTDGTAEAIHARYEEATVLQGQADQFWNRGMHAAFSHAVAHGPYDFYLWVNDDTELAPGALATVLRT